MRSLFSKRRVFLKQLLVDLHVGLSNDFVVGDQWKMIDVKERPLDGPKEDLVELLFFRKTSDMAISAASVSFCCVGLLDSVSLVFRVFLRFVPDRKSVDRSCIFRCTSCLEWNLWSDGDTRCNLWLKVGHNACLSLRNRE